MRGNRIRIVIQRAQAGPPLRLAAIASTALVGGCNRHQSALVPFGDDAADIRTITLVMVAVGAVIWVAMLALMRHAVRAPEGRLSLATGMRTVMWLGGILPTLLLAALLIYALPAMRPREVGPADLRIAVHGEQFWWRVAYGDDGPAAVVSANEIRLPVGRTVAIDLTGGDVIHSFWIPGLAGKMDMIPGRTNRLVVRATKPGRYRGVCTEFCGLSHALMAFDVVAMAPEAFDTWLAAERRPAAAPDGAGAALFAQAGCGGCHAIRGTDQSGTIGPDLTHFGARATLGAGTLDRTTANTAAFIRDPAAIKPGVRMPAFPQLSQADAVAIARYLDGLK